MSLEAKKLISEAKNICIIPSEPNESESTPSALALFYTLKELHKNVNLIIGDLPEKFNFLVPSLDFIGSPKNFVISIPRSVADISQIYYEKTEENLKVHLTVDNGRIKKDDISFYFENAKPDLVIALGIKDMQSYFTNQLDSFGFLLDVPIINIDTNFADSASRENKKFGAMNILENKSISEITLNLIVSLDEKIIDPSVSPNTAKQIAQCILTGLVVCYENFKSPNTSPEIFQLTAELIKKGAVHQQVIDNAYKATHKEVSFFYAIFQNLKTSENDGPAIALLDSNEFQNFGENEAKIATEKIKTIGIQNDLLVLWQSHASDPMVKGFLYSKKPEAIKKLSSSEDWQSPAARYTVKNDWVFLAAPGSDVHAVKEKIMRSLS